MQVYQSENGMSFSSVKVAITQASIFLKIITSIQQGAKIL